MDGWVDVIVPVGQKVKQKSFNPSSTKNPPSIKEQWAVSELHPMSNLGLSVLLRDTSTYTPEGIRFYFIFFNLSQKTQSTSKGKQIFCMCLWTSKHVFTTPFDVFRDVRTRLTCYRTLGKHTDLLNCKLSHLKPFPAEIMQDSG